MTVETETCLIDGKRRIALIFAYDQKTIDLIRQIPGRRWSASHRFWHIPFFRDYLAELNNRYQGIIRFIDRENKPAQKETDHTLEPSFPAEYIKAMQEYGLNEITIRGYKYQFNRFLRHFSGLPPEAIGEAKIRDYILYLIREKKYSVSSQNQAINAIKFYYEKVLGLVIEQDILPRPKKEHKLPKVLNEDEVAAILKEINNSKHRTMIFLIYATGMRLTELLHLKPEHLDLDGKKILITDPAGKQGRRVTLSPRMIKQLRIYLEEYPGRNWLFETEAGKQYSPRAVQKFFQNAVWNCRLKKPATLTILRNSFAVHLLEKGIDIRYVQQFMGHKLPMTTLRYLRASKRDIGTINSPLDNLDI